MTDILLALDPGESTGWSSWLIDDDAPLQRIDYGLIKGGLKGFVMWMSTTLGNRPDLIVCEEFNPHLGYGGGSAKNYEPLYIEGALYAMTDALQLEVVWQGADMKPLCSDEKLREQGLYISNAEARENPAISWMDARDVNDSQRHALAWAKLTEHEPTISSLWPEDAQ